MTDLDLLTKLDSIELMLQNQNLLQKQVLNFQDTALFLEISHSHLYKLTSTNVVPFYKPTGKKLYFKRDELEKFLLQNRSTTVDEIETQTANYLIKNRRS
jgi:excisionase family DNA binding protein